MTEHDAALQNLARSLDRLDSCRAPLMATLEIWYRDPRGYEARTFPLSPGAGFELDLLPGLDRPSGRVAKIRVSVPREPS